MNAKPTVAIIGGGIGGLATAYKINRHLKRTGFEVRIQLLEASSRVGGVILTKEQDGFLLEAGPDCFISEKPAALALARELGLENELIGTNPQYRQSFILRGARLISVPQGFYLMAPGRIGPFLKSPLISWPGKLRMMCEPLIPRRKSEADESLASFVTRRLGHEALARIAQPMIAGIYTADPKELSLQATMPRFLELEQKYGSVILGLWKQSQITFGKGKPSDGASGPRYGLFVSFRKGMVQLVRTLSRAIPDRIIRTNTKVVAIQRSGQQRWALELETGERLAADILCMALPAHAAASLLHPVAKDLSRHLNKIPYTSSLTINFAYDEQQVGHALDGMGFVVPAIEHKSFIGVSFSNRKFEGRAPKGRYLLRAFVGNHLNNGTGPELEEIQERVRNEVSKILRIDGAPLFTSAQPWTRSMSQYPVGHMNLVRTIEDTLECYPTLFLTGNAYRGVGIPDVIATAGDTAEKVSSHLQSP